MIRILKRKFNKYFSRNYKTIIRKNKGLNSID